MHKLIYNTMDKRIGFPEQLKYKEAIKAKGMKYIFVADMFNINQSIFSQFINGRLYMPDEVKTKLDNYLSL